MDPICYTAELRDGQEDVAADAVSMCRQDFLRAHYVFLIINKWYMDGKPDPIGHGSLYEIARSAYCPDLQLRLNIILDEISCPYMKTSVKEEFCRFFETYSVYGRWVGRRLFAEE